MSAARTESCESLECIHPRRIGNSLCLLFGPDATQRCEANLVDLLLKQKCLKKNKMDQAQHCTLLEFKNIFSIADEKKPRLRDSEDPQLPFGFPGPRTFLQLQGAFPIPGSGCECLYHHHHHHHHLHLLALQPVLERSVPPAWPEPSQLHDDPVLPWNEKKTKITPIWDFHNPNKIHHSKAAAGFVWTLAKSSINSIKAIPQRDDSDSDTPKAWVSRRQVSQVTHRWLPLPKTKEYMCFHTATSIAGFSQKMTFVNG